MGVDVEDLFIRPFRDVVALGTAAAANAALGADGEPESSERMGKAAQSLVKEGERALKKLQPIWDAQVEKYGQAFRDAIMLQGRQFIANHHLVHPGSTAMLSNCHALSAIAIDPK